MEAKPASDTAIVRKQGTWVFLATATNSALGFVFWALAARFFDTEIIGLAGTAIALSSLATSLSMLGLDNGLVRFIRKVRHPRRLLRQLGLVTGIVGLAVGIALAGTVFAAGLPDEPDLRLQVITVGAALTVFDLWFQLTDSSLLAAGRTELLAARNVAFGAGKVALLFLVVSWGAVGLLLAYTLPLLLIVLGGFTVSGFLWPKENPAGAEHHLREFAALSLGNYASGTIWFLPARIAPALIFLFLGRAEVAYFFLSMKLAEVVNYIPESLGKTVFAHGSRVEGLAPSLMRSLRKWLLLIMVPIVALGIVLSPLGLEIVGGSDNGPAYASHALVLQLFLVATLPHTVLQFLKAQFNVARAVRNLVILGSVTGLVTLAFLVAGLWARLPLDVLPLAWITGSAVACQVGAYLAKWRLPRLTGSGAEAS
jgi:O-antigen/teichoic acid export membrane protein